MPAMTSPEKTDRQYIGKRKGIAPGWPPARCPACEKPLTQNNIPFRGKHLPLDLRQCRDCGLVSGRPAVDTYDAEEYEYYRSLRGLPKERILNPLNRSRYSQLLCGFARLTAGRKLLDVGCGRGGFVAAALAGGWDAEGIELSEAAVSLAQSLGLPVNLKNFFQPSIPAGWDVIVMTEVIEHLSWPGDFIVRAEELLASGGLLYLTTPNWNSLERRVLGPEWDVIHREHLSYFNERSMRKVIARNSNLRLLSLKAENVKPAKMLFGKSFGSARKKSSTEISRAARTRDQAFRRRIYSSPALRACKWTANELLNCAKLGSTLKVICQKL